MRGWVVMVIGKTCVRLFAYLFCCYWYGLSMALLLVQNQWVDMRFDSAYVMTVLIGLCLWLCLVFLITEGRFPPLIGKGHMSTALVGMSIAIPVIVTLVNGSYMFMPAYLTRKAWFLDGALTISYMNGLLTVWFVLGFVSLYFLRKGQMVAFQGQRLTAGQKTGIGILSGSAALFALLYLGLGSFQQVVNDAVTVMKQADVLAFRDYLLSFGPLAAIVSGLLMVFQSIIAPLPAFVITFANGLVFGWLWGALLSWMSAMVGAILCFYLAKWIGRPVVERFISRKALSWWNHFFHKYGAYAILIARLVPIVSFDFVSYAAGVTPVTFWHFFWATGVGQLPATLLYSYLGKTATGVVEILFLLFMIVIALAIVGWLLKPHFHNLKGHK